jgi:hypothetical protein
VVVVVQFSRFVVDAGSVCILLMPPTLIVVFPTAALLHPHATQPRPSAPMLAPAPQKHHLLLLQEPRMVPSPELFLELALGVKHGTVEQWIADERGELRVEHRGGLPLDRLHDGLAALVRVALLHRVSVDHRRLGGRRRRQQHALENPALRGEHASLAVAAAELAHQQPHGAAQRAPLSREKWIACRAVGDRGQDAARLVLMLLCERPRAVPQDHGRRRRCRRRVLERRQRVAAQPSSTPRGLLQQPGSSRTLSVFLCRCCRRIGVLQRRREPLRARGDHGQVALLGEALLPLQILLPPLVTLGLGVGC